MNLRWNNIFLAFLLLVSFIIVIKNKAAIFGFLDEIPSNLSSGNPNGQIKGFIALGVILVSLVCFTKIIVNGNKQQGPKD